MKRSAVEPHMFVSQLHDAIRFSTVTPGYGFNTNPLQDESAIAHWRALVTDARKYGYASDLSRFIVIAPTPVLELFFLNCVFNELFPGGHRTLAAACSVREAIRKVACRLQCTNNMPGAAAANFRLCCLISGESHYRDQILDLPSVLWRRYAIHDALVRRVYQFCGVKVLFDESSGRPLLLSSFPEFPGARHFTVWSPDSVNAYVGDVEARKRRTLAWYLIYRHLFKGIELIQFVDHAVLFSGADAQLFVQLMAVSKIHYALSCHFAPRGNRFESREAPIGMRFFKSDIFRGGYSLKLKPARADHNAALITWKNDEPHRTWDRCHFVGELISDKVRKRVKINDE